MAFRAAAVEQSSPSFLTSNCSQKTSLVDNNEAVYRSAEDVVRPTSGQDPPPETPADTDWDLAAMLADGDVTTPPVCETEASAGETQTIMPEVAPVGAKLDSALAQEKRWRERCWRQ